MEIFFAMILVCSAAVPWASCEPDTALHGEVLAGEAGTCVKLAQQLAQLQGDPYTKLWCGSGTPVKFDGKEGGR